MTMSKASACRLLDLALLGVTAPIWVPLVAGVAACAAVSSGRPIFFQQQRLGTDGRPFALLKFRTMTAGDNPLIPDPARITPIGKVLRRWSLDELPQLLNVARGEMSLVGPRPMLPSQAEHLSVHQRRRFATRPGLTGLAQISGRNALPWSKRVELDLVWTADPSLRRYASILSRTARVVLSGDGVEGHTPNDPLQNPGPAELDLRERMRNASEQHRRAA